MAENTARALCPESVRITAHIPMAHVADVEQSIAFYAFLGFEATGRVTGFSGVTNWAMLASGDARIMFARADGPLSPEVEGVIFYMYSRDVRSLREHLIASGLRDAGPFSGAPMGGEGRGAVSAVSTPFYMPGGELRIEDLDRYCILVGQLER